MEYITCVYCENRNMLLVLDNYSFACFMRIRILHEWILNEVGKIIVLLYVCVFLFLSSLL